jgi:hypothetical protein
MIWFADLTNIILVISRLFADDRYERTWIPFTVTPFSQYRKRYMELIFFMWFVTPVYQATVGVILIESQREI